MSIERCGPRRDGSRPWMVRWREGVRNRGRVFDTKRDAEVFQSEVRRRRQLGGLGVDEGQRTLAELWEEWRRMHFPDLAPATRRSYEGLWTRYLRDDLGPMKLRELGPREIEEFARRLRREGVGEANVERTLIVLRGMLGRAAGWGWVERNAAAIATWPKKRNPRRVPRMLAAEDVERIRSGLGLRDSTMVAVLAYVGTRPGEMLGLRWGDVGDGSLHVGRSVSMGAIVLTKTRRTRVARLPGPVKHDLDQWRMACGRPGDGELVFPGPDGMSPWTEDEWRAWRRGPFRRAVVAAGLDRELRPYDLRHVAVSLALHERRSVVEVASWMGHAPGVTLDTYGHLIDSLAGTEPVPMDEMIARARHA